MEQHEHMKVSVLAVIPARGGSKGIPRKNIVDVCGKPLIVYAIDAAHKAKSVDATIVSTDDLEIQQIARSHGADVPFLRPMELATDTARDIDVLQHALEWVERERGWRPNVVILLPPTSPTRTSHDIDAAVELLQKTGATSVRTVVHPAHWNPHKMWVAGAGEGTIVPLMATATQGVPRQQLPRWYMPVGIAYVLRREFIQKGELWGDDVHALEVSMERYSDIDSPEDLIEVAAILGQTD